MLILDYIVKREAGCYMNFQLLKESTMLLNAEEFTQLDV